MSYPVGNPPSSAYVEGTVGDAQGQSEASIRAGLRASGIGGFGQGQNNLWGSGGFLGFLTQGIFGFIGGVADFIGGFLGIKNQVNQVVNVTVPALQNQINEISEGGVSASRAFFGTSGTWTKPAGQWSRHIIDVIGGGSGGGCGDTTFGDNGVGGWVGGWAQAEFFDSDLPSTLTVTVGLGGVGATTTGAQGGNGGTSTVVGYLSAGGGTGSFSGSAGFGSKTIASIRGGVGGRSTAAASPGTGHDYAAGGLAGTGPGGKGGDGNTPTPSTKAYPGTGGGGGSYVNNVGLNGGNGGNGGYPGGPGGGGAAPGFGGARGNGGNGAAGGVWITSYK